MTQSSAADGAFGNMLRDWDARNYLDCYYGSSNVPEDEVAMFRFVARGLRDIGTHFDRALELGCGPVLHHAAQVVPWVKQLDMADFQESNLEEIRRWLRRDPRAFDWSAFIAGEGGVLDAEEGSGGSLAEREALLRSRIGLMTCDLRETLPLGRALEYPLVASWYCSEWVVPTLSGWQQTMEKIASLVARSGWLVLAGVHATDFCVINGRRVPCAHLTTSDIRVCLERIGFDPSTVRLDVTPGLAPAVTGIQGTFMAYAKLATE